MSKVFIIDDDPIHQRIAQLMLNRCRLYDIYTGFTEAGEALVFLEQHAKCSELLPDIILLDLNMPVITGWEVLERFKELQKMFSKDIRIYIVSSSVDKKDISRSQSYPFVKGFFSKPLSPDILIQIV